MADVRVVAHDPGWANEYQGESERIRVWLKDHSPVVHHIGSTSIPEICAKPVIDMLLAVVDVSALDAAAGRFADQGYEVMGEYGIRGRRYFRKRPAQGRQFHLHAYSNGDPNIATHLLFRDYLRTHPDVADAYSRLKASLASQHPDDRARYQDAKAPFIKRVIVAAHRWRQ